MASDLCGQDCCDVQTDVLDLAANLECQNLDTDFVQSLIASGILKLLCQSFIVYDAWTPVVGVEQQGTDLAFKVIDWFGGSGTKPDTGYIGTSGLVELFADANIISLSVAAAGANVYIGEYTAGEDISSLRLVNISADDTVLKADATLAQEAHGIIISSVTTGNTVSVFSMGVFNGFSGTLGSGGTPYYLGVNGLRSLTP